jgi:hypothetical protein
VRHERITERGATELSGATLPAVPAVVLMRTPGRWDGHDVDQAIDRSWQEHQGDLARHCRAPLVVAANSGHDIPGQAPSLVALVIDEVVHAVRRGDRQVSLIPLQVEAAGGDLRIP